LEGDKVERRRLRGADGQRREKTWQLDARRRNDILFNEETQAHPSEHECARGPRNKHLRRLNRLR
jgi:hypothetical protein